MINSCYSSSALSLESKSLLSKKSSKPLPEYEIISSGYESFLSRYRNMRLLFRMREPFKPLPEYEIFSSGCDSFLGRYRNMSFLPNAGIETDTTGNKEMKND